MYHALSATSKRVYLSQSMKNHILRKVSTHLTTISQVLLFVRFFPKMLYKSDDITKQFHEIMFSYHTNQICQAFAEASNTRKRVQLWNCNLRYLSHAQGINKQIFFWSALCFPSFPKFSFVPIYWKLELLKFIYAPLFDVM